MADDNAAAEGVGYLNISFVRTREIESIRQSAIHSCFLILFVLAYSYASRYFCHESPQSTYDSQI